MKMTFDLTELESLVERFEKACASLSMGPADADADAISEAPTKEKVEAKKDKAPAKPKPPSKAAIKKLNDEAKLALRNVYEKHGKEFAKDLLGKADASAISQVKVENLKDFVEACNEALKETDKEEDLFA